MQRAGDFECADQVEVDVLKRQVVDQPSALAEEEQAQLNFDHVEHNNRQFSWAVGGAAQVRARLL